MDCINIKKVEIITASRNLESEFESKINVVMEQNPSKKTKLKSEQGADVKLW